MPPIQTPAPTVAADGTITPPAGYDQHMQPLPAVSASKLTLTIQGNPYTVDWNQDRDPTAAEVASISRAIAAKEGLSAPVSQPKGAIPPFNPMAAGATITKDPGYGSQNEGANAKPYVDIPRHGQPGSGVPRTPPTQVPDTGVFSPPSTQQLLAARKTDAAAKAAQAPPPPISGGGLFSSGTVPPGTRVAGIKQPSVEDWKQLAQQSNQAISNAIAPVTDHLQGAVPGAMQIQALLNQHPEMMKTLGAVKDALPEGAAKTVLSAVHGQLDSVQQGKALTQGVAGLINLPIDVGADAGILAAHDATPWDRAGAITNIILKTSPGTLLKPFEALSAARNAIGDAVTEGIGAGAKSLDVGGMEPRGLGTVPEGIAPAAAAARPSVADPQGFQKFVDANWQTRTEGLLNDVQRYNDSLDPGLTRPGAKPRGAATKSILAQKTALATTAEELHSSLESGQPHPAVVAELQDIYDAQSKGTAPNVMHPTVPETDATLSAQMEALQAGRKQAVLVTPGETAPTVPDGFVTTDTPVGTFIHSADLAPETNVEPKSASTTMTVVARDPKTGVELQSAIVSPENMGAQVQQFAKTYPGSKIQVVADRQATVPPAQPQPAAPAPATAPAIETPPPAPSIPTPEGAAPRTRADAMADFHRLIAEAKESGSAGMMGGEKLSKYLEAGTYLVEAGLRGFSEWAGKMVEAFGKEIKPHLKDLYEQAHAGAQDVTSRFSRAIAEAEPIQGDWEKAKATQRSAQAARLAAAQSRTSGRGSFYAGLGAMKGEFERPLFTSLEGKLSPAEIDQLHEIARTDPGLRPFERATTQGALEKVIRGHLPTDGELQLLAKVYGPDVVKTILSKRGLLEKGLDYVLRYERSNLLSGVPVLSKLASATGSAAITSPIEEGLGAGLRKVPGLSGVAEKAGYEAQPSIQGEAAAAKEFTKAATYKDAWQKLTTGKNELDTLYAHTTGRATELNEINGNGFLDFFGNLHGAMKTPLQRSAFQRSAFKQIDRLAAQGTHISPDVLANIHAQAYQDSLRAILRNENVVGRFWQNTLQGLTKATGSAAPAKIARIANPIVNVGTNLAGRTGEYVAGIPYGGMKLIKGALTDGLTDAEAQATWRAFKRGGVGAGLMALGYFRPGIEVGGYWSPDRAKSDTDLKPMQVRLTTPSGNKVMLPDWLAKAFLHSPQGQAVMFGATMRQIDNKQHAFNAAAAGVAENVPLFDRIKDLDTMLFGKVEEKGKAAGRFTSGFIPAVGMQHAIATATDSTPRSPKGFWDEIYSNIPGLREKVTPAGQKPMNLPGMGTMKVKL